MKWDKPEAEWAQGVADRPKRMAGWPSSVAVPGETLREHCLESGEEFAD
jgi:hypothetical protein